jgi:hypothetical protein
VTLQEILEFIARKIADEGHLSEPYHRGRISAFELARDLIKEHQEDERAKLRAIIKQYGGAIDEQEKALRGMVR